MKLFEHKPFDRKAVLGFGILNGISIGLLNLSLGFNSVGFYQVPLLFVTLVQIAVYIYYVFIIFLKTLILKDSVDFSITDDQAGNHPLYRTLGDPFPWEDIQVSLEKLFTLL